MYDGDSYLDWLNIASKRGHYINKDIHRERQQTGLLDNQYASYIWAGHRNTRNTYVGMNSYICTTDKIHKMLLNTRTCSPWPM